ncbi:MICOS complex subunit MIC13 homolog QIL1 isoform X1 [Megalopta genalis]|uniref:MICOS complex subunit MIC13 homolog QIL1 isoform X1 n=1 Tax=Megalopta genalis TaxID=115081 RepID=UPI003FD0A427
MGLIRLVRELKFQDAERLWFIVKTTIVGGTVYYTCQEGLWSKSEDTAKLYGKLYNSIAPYVKHNAPREIISQVEHLPSINCIVNGTKMYWNRGVMSSMKFISNLPDHACNGVNKIKEAIEKNLKEQKQ